MGFGFKTTTILAGVTLAFGLAQSAVAAPRQMENLSRGLAVSNVGNGVLVSWRLLGTELADTEFNLYRDGTKIASIGKTEGTNYLDKDGKVTSKYTVAPVVNGKEGALASSSIVFDEYYNVLRFSLNLYSNYEKTMLQIAFCSPQTTAHHNHHPYPNITYFYIKSLHYLIFFTKNKPFLKL